MTSDRTVYLLGAGFSKSVAPVMPLMGELGVEVLDRLGMSTAKLSAFESNLEVWLSYLATVQPWITEAQALENRALFLRVSEAIHDAIGSSEAAALREPLPMSGARLVWQMSRESSDVLTFNYDRLLERLALSFAAGHTFTELYGAPLTERMKPGTYGFLSHSTSRFPTMRLYKLHGSVNWFARSIGQLDRSDVFISSLSGRWAPSEWSPEPPPALSDLVPLVIPPVASKSDFYSNSVLRSQWRAAAESLSSASKLVIIGYSFPRTDTQARFFVSTNLPPDALVEVVDLGDQVVSNIRSFLPNKVTHVARTVDDYVRVAPDVVEWRANDWPDADSRGEAWVNNNRVILDRPELLHLLRSSDRPSKERLGTDLDDSDESWIHRGAGASTSSPFRSDAHLIFRARDAAR